MPNFYMILAIGAKNVEPILLMMTREEDTNWETVLSYSNYTYLEHCCIIKTEKLTVADEQSDIYVDKRGCRYCCFSI